MNLWQIDSRGLFSRHLSFENDKNKKCTWIQNVELKMAHESIEDIEPYERLLGAAIDGDPTLFAHQDAVEASWEVIDPLLKNLGEVNFYKPGTWGPEEANSVLLPGASWHNPEL